MGQPPHGFGCERTILCGVSQFASISFSDVSLSAGHVFRNALLRDHHTALTSKEKTTSRRPDPSCFQVG